MTSFPLQSTTFLLPGAVGDLEVAVDVCDAPSVKGVALLCHPHPLYGGTMHNKVITTAAKAFNLSNMHAVRFNYRGVGESEGEFGQVVGEVEDGRAVMDWIQSVLPDTPIYLLGFSFGSAVAAELARIYPPEILFSLAPAVHHYQFERFEDIRVPWIVIQGEEDEVVPPQSVYDWVETMPQTIKLIKLSDTSHFFHRKLLDLRQLLLTELTKA